jgi:hypothetical protein
MMSTNLIKMEIKFFVSVEVEVDDSGYMEATGRVSRRFVVPGSRSTEWPAELHKTHEIWTRAFKGMPMHDVVGQPSRLLNLQTGEVFTPRQPVQYAAVSYVWAQWAGRLDAMLLELKDLAKPMGLEFAWLDQKCIDQTSVSDKAVEIKRMGEYYSHAAITFVMVPEWSTSFTWELAGFAMTKEEAAKANAEINALKETAWISRVWTFQEALLSNRVVFVGRAVAKSAVELAIVEELGETPHDVHGYLHASWNRTPDGLNHVTVRFCDKKREGSSPVIASSIFRDSQLLKNTTSAPLSYRFLDGLWRKSGQRQCKKVGDRVYGMMGMLQNAGAIAITPDIRFEEAVRQAADLGLILSDIFLTKTGSEKLGRSWCPQPGTEGEFCESEAGWYSMVGQRLLQPIQLTEEGFCKVEGFRFQIPSKPKRSTRKDYLKSAESICLEYNDPKRLTQWDSLECTNLESGKSFSLEFDNEVPEGEDWMGDWFAILNPEEGSYPSRSTIIKYKIGDKGVLRRLTGLDVDISTGGLEDTDRRHFLIG